MFRCLQKTIAFGQTEREFDTNVDGTSFNNSQPGPIQFDFSGLIKKPQGDLKFIAAITGFKFRWPGDQHLLFRVLCRADVVDVDQEARSCKVRIVAGMRDDSLGGDNGEFWNDHFTGELDVRVAAIDDADAHIYTNSKQFRYDRHATFPAQDTDFIQLNKAKGAAIPFLRGFELDYQNRDHSVMRMQAGIKPKSDAQGATDSVFLTCEAGLKDNESTHVFGGLVHYSVLAIPGKLYPFVLGQNMQFAGKTGGVGHATTETTIVGAKVKDNQVFFGLAATDHQFTNKEHPLHRYEAVTELKTVAPDGQNTNLDFALSAALEDHSGTFDDPYDVRTEINVVASSN